MLAFASNHQRVRELRLQSDGECDGCVFGVWSQDRIAMIRKAVMGVRRYWREALAAIAPFVLLLPLLELTSRWWISPSIMWFKADVMQWLIQILGSGFIHLFFNLPIFAASIVAGLAFGIVNAQRARRLAWVFGIGMFVAQTVPAYLVNPSKWYLCLFNLAHVVLPVATAAALLRLRKVNHPGHCKTCDYDLTGNVTGICSECGTPIAPEK